MTIAADSPFPPLDPADTTRRAPQESTFGLLDPPIDVSPAFEVGSVDDDDEPSAVEVTGLTLGPFAERYTLLQTLGVGGMGVVQLAYDRVACRNVAIKRIKPSYADTSFTERFRREYRALAAIEHPGVPAIYDIGETAEGEPYFAMQIITGETIRGRLRRETKIPPARALALAIDLGRVLAAVHAAGVIHRDVKPDNVILEGERVRLIDFGAALLTADYYDQPHLRDPTEAGKRWRTSETEWIGNPAYMCPQWVNEGKVSPGTDVFSVCVVLYEMITGRRLYAREVYRHREIRAEEFAPELGPLVIELRRGVSRVAERHRSMAELVRALEIVRSRLAAPAKRSSLPFLAASVASFALGVGATVALLRAATPGEPVAASASVEPSVVESSRAVEPTNASAAVELLTVEPSRIDEPPVVQPPVVAPPVVEPSRIVEPAGAGAVVESPESPRVVEAAAASAVVESPEPPRPEPWRTRMRRAEARARACLKRAKIDAEPLLTTIAAGEPANVRGAASDSPETRCIREALDRFDLHVAKGQRQHTFFDR
ncbi:serine/threonine protein kinase [Nannocystis bainbridge]|uniref:Serine/threonine-protein kinase n=1 Tax=Nannocystis bainbridge TaxID=2995303 RepID=A0ABT5DRI5_9BACT|nr:serine/threonine-protein kinase [Nannocystis bainbridge]MDC0716228.1 serine/threonine-protein kinase [Nannocystis bainbridge]